MRGDWNFGIFFSNTHARWMIAKIVRLGEGEVVGNRIKKLQLSTCIPEFQHDTKVSQFLHISAINVGSGFGSVRVVCESQEN